MAEIMLRLAGSELATPRLPLRYDVRAIDRLEDADSYVMFDQALGWLPTPDFDRVADGIDYHNNHEALRAEREYGPTPAPGVRRIAAYGDSYTYCDEGRLEDCWASGLEQVLPDTEVLNFGVPGYGPDQAWLRYRQGGAGREPCAVTIGYTVENINRVVNRFRPFYGPGTGIALSKPRFVLDGGELTLLPNPVEDADQLKDPVWVEATLGPHDAWYFPGTFVPNPLDELEVVRVARTATYKRQRGDGERWDAERATQMYRPGTEPFEVTVAVLAGFADQVRADGATPVVLIFPWTEEILAARNEHRQAHAPLVEALRSRGVAVIDLSDALGVAARDLKVGQLVAQHYTPLGNEIVQDTLADQLPLLTRATCGPW